VYVPGVLEEGVISPFPFMAIPEGEPRTQVELPVPPAPVIVGETGVEEEVQMVAG
jgi:hypothetical protein